MLNRIPVHQKGVWIYDIVMENSFNSLGKELEALDLKKRRICIVSDSNVASIYLDEVDKIVSSCCSQVEHYLFPAGEENKNLDTVKDLYEKLILKHFDRHDVLLALGGGVVGDLCGFAAATYLRGVDYIQIPTTLLAQVDSSIGGKTGVDFSGYKNMVGAFHMPRLVYVNTGTLLTLEERQFSSGMGEVIKHGLIKDRAYYEWIIRHSEDIRSRDLGVCAEMIARSQQIKRDVVEKDPTEQGERALLNFGHTLGHAIEKLTNFDLLHGSCVGLGCIAAAYISAQKGMISTEEVEQLVSLMTIFGIPDSINGLNPEDVITVTMSDKKMDSGVIRFILLRQIGQAYVDKTVTEKEMAAGLSYILK